MPCKGIMLRFSVTLAPKAKCRFSECHLPSPHRWLIEVNASPSHTPSSREDYEMKFRLLEDTLNVVDMEGR